MDDSERFLFDLQGYLVVRRALTPGQVAELTTRLDAALATDEPGSAPGVLEEDHGRAWSTGSLLGLGGPFLELVDLPTIAPYLEELLGSGYRLDHDYLQHRDASDPGRLFLHGGGGGSGGPGAAVGASDGGQCYYRYQGGRFYNGLVAVAIELETVPEGAGGFACVPGSHKSNLALPDELRYAPTQAEIPPLVERVTVAAGDAIIFTEALAHGTVPWQGPGRRRTLFLKYCPHAVAWSPIYYNADHYPGLTDTQRLRLLPPSAYGPRERAIAAWRRAQDEQAELDRLRAAAPSPQPAD